MSETAAPDFSEYFVNYSGGIAHDTQWCSVDVGDEIILPSLGRLLFWRCTIDESARHPRTNMPRATALVTWASVVKVPRTIDRPNVPDGRPFEVVFSADGSNWVSVDGGLRGYLLGVAGRYEALDPNHNSVEIMTAAFEKELVGFRAWLAGKHDREGQHSG